MTCGYFGRSCTSVQACLASEPELTSPACSHTAHLRSIRARGEQASPECVTGCLHNFPASGGTWTAEDGGTTSVNIQYGLSLKESQTVVYQI